MSHVPPHMRNAYEASIASMEGAASPLDQIAATLEFSASQLQPALNELSRVLGVEVDAVGFALGTLASALSMGGVDLLKVIPELPTQMAEFVARCEAMQGRVVCANRGKVYPQVTCGLDPGHKGQHGAGRLRW